MLKPGARAAMMVGPKVLNTDFWCAERKRSVTEREVEERYRSIGMLDKVPYCYLSFLAEKL